MTAPATLVSLIKTQKRQSEISSTNLAHADQEGYVRKEVDIISLGANQYGFGGVTLSQVYNTVDPALQAQTRLNNAILSKSQVIDKVYQDLNVMFGSKGGKTTFSHELGRLAASFTGIMAKPDLPAKTECINHAVAFSKSISSMAEKVNNSLTQVDQETGKIVDKINELVKQIADANKTISKFYTDTKPSTPLVPGYMDITTFETDRAQLVHELAGLIEINVSTTSDNKLNISMTEGGGMLVQGAYSYQLDYMPASAVKPGDVLSPVSYLGTDITAKIKNGQLGGMLQLRDKDLVRAQAEFDELTRVVRDTVNALHNQGASLKGSSSLTGTISVPSLAGLPMTGTTHVSGTGTLRLAVIDTMGTIVDYKDVSLTDGMTIDTLIATVNGASYTIGGGATPAAGGGILLEQLSSGALKLSSTSGHTIALGSVSGMPAPQISGGVTYDAATGLGFSHFFGLNNFFDTGGQYYCPSRDC